MEKKQKGKLGTVLERAKQHQTGRMDSNVRKMPTTAEARQPEIQSKLSYQKVSFDRKCCARNRILIPDSVKASNSRGAASYRMLRTRVLQRARSNDWRTIGVTSPGAGDGKSITALNLAFAVAREKNNSVFLIDLDMRNPKLCRYLGTRPPVELGEYLTGNADHEDVLFSIGIDNLTLAGTLTPVDQSSELLARGRIEELFAYIRRVAPKPLIILDLPPVLSTDDALVMAPKVDGFLLVLSEGRSRREGAASALELLSEFNLVGIVLNRSRAVVADYYTSSGY